MFGVDSFTGAGAIGWVKTMIITPMFWLLIILFVVGGLVFILWMRKRKALQFEAIEVVNLGENKKGFNLLKCGWFGREVYLKGLWTRGQEVMMTSEMEEIVNFSEEDFQEVNGQRGIIFTRHPETKMLMPLHKLNIVNAKEIFGSIPPADYVEFSTRKIQEAQKEVSDWKEKVMQFVGWALIVIVSLVAIIVIVQYVKTSQKEASDLILKAGETCLSNAKEVCSNLYTTIKSTAP